MRKIKHFLNGLTTQQLLILSQRYDVNTVYINPQKRRAALLFQIKKYLEKQEMECAICLEAISYNTIISTPCVHLFCDSCLLRHIIITETCPICRLPCPYTYVFDHIFYDRITVLDKIVKGGDEETREEQDHRYIEELVIASQLQQIRQPERTNMMIVTNYYSYVKGFFKYIIHPILLLLCLLEFISLLFVILESISRSLNIY